MMSGRKTRAFFLGNVVPFESKIAFKRGFFFERQRGLSVRNSKLTEGPFLFKSRIGLGIYKKLRRDGDGQSEAVLKARKAKININYNREKNLCYIN